MRGQAEQIAGTIVERATGRHLLLLSDFDGTLCEFNPDPAAVRLSAARRQLLDEIVGRAVSLGIVSGRRLADLRPRLGSVRADYLAGFHGLEIEAPAERFVHPDVLAAQPLIREIAERLAPAVASLPGVFVEDKDWSIALHFRDASPAAQIVAQSRFSEVVRPRLASGTLRVLPGSCVLELMPGAEWHKGSAVQWIRDRVGRQHASICTAYIGDDVTDEDGFAALEPGDAGIGASDRVSRAEFQVDGPAGVETLLRALCSKLS